MDISNVNQEMLKTLYFDYGPDCDKQYNARASVLDYELEAKKYEDFSLQAKAENFGIYDLKYGAGVNERLDIFPLSEKEISAPVFIFIHGGYWRAQRKESSCFMATAMRAQGIVLCTVEYTLMPETTLGEIIREVRSAIAWLYKNAKTYGIDREQMIVGGSSAGGHLAAMLAAEGWSAYYDLPDDIIKGVISLSGLYEVAPLCYTHVNEWLRMHPDYTSMVSPLWNLPRANLPMYLAVGEFEPEGFKRQMAIYEDQCKRQGVLIDSDITPNRNHFDIVLDMCDVDSRVSQALRAMIRN